MRKTAYALAIAAGVLTASFAQAATITDTVQAPTGFFVPTDAQKTAQPYYRGENQDWGWTHGAIAGTITSATLNISAYDVDYDANDPRSEIDNIYAYVDGVKTLLGHLDGGNNIYSFTTFTLGSNFFDDIANGLQVFVDIDSANTGLWDLTLAKSSLSIDGGELPPAAPGVPEPASWAMFIAGFGAIGGSLRRRKPIATFA